MTWTSFDAVWWPYLFILLAAGLPTMLWRWMGVFLSGDLDENSALLHYVRCVSTALVAAVVAQFIFAPTGPLGDISIMIRSAASVVGFSAFLASRSLLVGILAGEAALMLGAIYIG